MNIAYVRVSSADQNEERQIKALEGYNIDKWFVEKVSGKNLERPEYKTMMDYCREGDTIYIHDLSRLSRSTSDLLQVLERLEEKKVHLHSNKENIDTSTPTGRLFITIVAAINEFERTNLKDRQAEGIRLAKEKGKYRKPHRTKDYDKELFETLYAKYKERGYFHNKPVTKSLIAKELELSRPTVDKIIKECENKNIQKEMEA